MRKNINKKLLTLLVWLALVALFVVLNLDTNPRQPTAVKNINQLNLDINENKVERIFINYKDNLIYAYLRDSKGTYKVGGYLDEDQMENVYEKGVAVEYTRETNLQKLSRWFNKNFSDILASFLPILIFLAFFVYFLKKGQGQQGTFLALKDSKARLIVNGTDVNFNDIGGLDEIKDGVKDVVSFLKDPKPWIEGGGKLPRGIILEGPPGTGKTLFARALASECKAHFYATSGSEFVELFVGVGASRIRDLFEKARATAPSVIFIDEIDAIGRKRSVGHGLGSEEWDNTLNQLLACMDGFNRLDRVLVVAATNRLDVLDPALMRAGRFDRSFSMKILTEQAIEQILAVHLRGKKLSSELSITEVAKKLSGITGAEIETIVNESSLAAISRYIEEKVKNKDAQISLTEGDITTAYHNFLSRRGRLANFDNTILESDSRFVTFRVEQAISVELVDNKIIQGTVIWASPSLIKLKTNENVETLIRKAQILSLRS